MRKVVKYVLPVLTFAAGVAGKSLYDANQKKRIDQKHLQRELSCEWRYNERLSRSISNIEDAFRDVGGYSYSTLFGAEWRRDVIIGNDTITSADMRVLHELDKELVDKVAKIRNELIRNAVIFTNESK